jgi:hypothetical protein
MAAVGDDIPLSEGGELLLKRLRIPSGNPLWVLVWGGANALAQVLHKIRNWSDVAELRSKLRVHGISDQDDTSAWIRQQWPEIFYICSVQYMAGVNIPMLPGVGSPVTARANKVVRTALKRVHGLTLYFPLTLTRELGQIPSLIAARGVLE